MEYADITVERAIWQSFGQRVDEMTAADYEIKTAVLRLEAAHEERKRNEPT